MTAYYESPEVVIALSKEEIHKRYQDAAVVIFKEQQNRKKDIVRYLTFGNSRRTIEYSNNGNHPVIIRRPADSLIMENTHLSSQMFKKYHKLGKNCTIT